MAGGNSLQSIEKCAKKIASSKVTLILLLLIPIFFAFFFRAYPVTLPITDTWAEQTVEQNVVNQVQAQLQEQFPRVPPAQLRGRAQEQYLEYRAQNEDEVQAQVQALSKSYKSQLQLTLNKSDGTSYEQTYFLAIDPYQWLRRTENIIETGTICDEIRDGVCWNTHIKAPHGASMYTKDFHTYTEVFFARIGMLFGFAPMTGAFYLPAIIAALAVIPAFFIVQQKYGGFAGSVGALIVGIHAVFLSRTPAGFVDTDIWNMFFPLYIVFLILFAIDAKDKMKYVWIVLAGLLTGLYQRFWSGWFFTFFIISAVLVAMVVYYLLQWFITKRKSQIHDEKIFSRFLDAAKSLGVYVPVTALVVSLIDSPSIVWRAFTAPFALSTSLQDPIQTSLFPNVLTTVAELNTASLASIISQIGGRILFVAAIVGILAYSARDQDKDWTYWGVALATLVYYIMLTSSQALGWNPRLWLILFFFPLAAIMIFRLFSAEESTVHYELLLMTWMGASIFATTQGTRFLILIIPIFGVALGFVTGWLVRVGTPLLEREAKIPKVFGSTGIMLIILILLFTPIHANMFSRAHNVGINEVPSMNDAWWNGLKAIEADSDPNAIITSWWDFGHWFKYVADRSVNFDGGSQTLPNAHWVGKILQTDSEEESMALLRMINCGANGAYESIIAQKKNTLDSYHLVREIVLLSEEDAVDYLIKNGITSDEARRIVSEETHCIPPDSYVIVSEDMVGKAGVWGHFATWDFDRAFIYSVYKSQSRVNAIPLIAQELEITQAEATQLYTEVASLQNSNQQASRDRTNAWISPWPGYMGSFSCQENNETVVCPIRRQIATQDGVAIVADSLQINKSEVENATIVLTAQGQVVGVSTPSSLSLNGEMYDLDGDFSLSASINDGRLIIADPLLADSMFTQWFYYEKPGPYASLLTKQVQITGGKILIYKIDWDAYLSRVEG